MQVQEFVSTGTQNKQYLKNCYKIILFLQYYTFIIHGSNKINVTKQQLLPHLSQDCNHIVHCLWEVIIS